MLGQRVNATASRILFSDAFHTAADPSKRIVTAQMGRCRKPMQQEEGEKKGLW